MRRTGTGKNDKEQEAIDQSMVMGRFRPIAPRPVPPGSATEPKKPPYVRIKRRYIKKIKPFNTINSIISMGNRNRDPMAVVQPPAGACVCSGGGGGSREEGSSTMRIFAQQEEQPPPPPPPPISIYPNKMADYPTGSNLNAGGAAARRAVKSWLEVYGMKKTVPAGQEASAAGGGLCGNSYSEKMTNLQHDICPVLISDCEQRVKYMNPAYKKMGDVVRGHVEEEEEAEEDEDEEEGGGPLVWIVVKDNLPDTWKRFTCVGTVVHIWGKQQHRQTMPCDVWRMDFGEFVWRLDPEAALKLGI